jgi:acyl carrier protein
MSSKQQIRHVLDTYARLTVRADQLEDSADLFAVGLESHSAVTVMLALEAELGFEFPDDRLRRATFASIAALDSAIEEMGIQESTP